MTFSYVPKTCPSCSSELEWRNHDLYCPNPNCSAKASASLFHWLRSMCRRNILGLGDSLLEAMVDFYGWKTVEDIYENPVSIDSCEGMASMEGIGEAKIGLVRQALHNLLKEPVSFTGFLASLNIKGISYAVGGKLEESNLEECLKNDAKGSFTFGGNAVKQSVLDSWSYISRMYALTERLHIPSVKKSTSTEPAKTLLKVCITGKAEDGLSRSQFYQRYSDSITESSVASCEYLVCNSPSNSSKIKTAKAKGIKVITEAELRGILESHA